VTGTGADNAPVLSREDAKFVRVSIPTLLGIPYDAASSYLRGAAAAPPKIRAALRSPAGNPWTEQLVDLSAPDAMRDDGDLDMSHEESAFDTIKAGIQSVVTSGGLPVVLGGDHSITYPIMRALRKHHARLTLLQIDAHSDLYDNFEGNRYSHACAFARIMEGELADRLVQVGIRAMTGHLKEQASRFGVEVIDMRGWQRGARPSFEGPVYISIDLDGIDPGYAPGVGHPEPGGLSVREVIELIHNIPGPLIGADVVEYNPTVDATGLTAVVAAKLVKEVIGCMHSSDLGI
jgi:agmatinase